MKRSETQLKSRTKWALTTAGFMIFAGALLAGYQESAESLGSGPPEGQEEPAGPPQPPAGEPDHGGLHEHQPGPGEPGHRIPGDEKEPVRPPWEDLPDLAEALAAIRGDTPQMIVQGIGMLARHLEWGTTEAKAQAQAELLVATRHRDPGIVGQACAALRNTSAPEAVVKRLSQLNSHANPGISAAAADSLAIIHSRNRDIVGLISLLGIHYADASGKAAIQLGLMKRRPVPELIKAVRTSPNAAQRHGAATVLAMLCAGTNPQQEKFAAQALATRHGWAAQGEAPPADLRALPVFAEALINDESAQVREMCAQGLGYLGDPTSAGPLAKALSDPVQAVRRRAASALITVPAEPAREALERALVGDESAAVRRYAAEALGWIGGSSVVPALIEAAGHDPDAEVRRYVAVQLGRMREDQPDAQALEALVGLFDDEDEDVRWAAVVAVGRLRDREARQHLVAALDDPSPMVSHAAETGLQKLGIAQRKAPEFK